MEQSRIGIVGSGSISCLHLSGMARHADRVKAVALADPDEKTRNARAAEHGICTTFATVQEMISAGGIDAAIVCTPTQVRSEVIMPLIEAGIPVLCEKPFAETYEEALAIERAARKHRVAIAINQNFRRHFSFAQAREILKSGEIGKALHLMHIRKGLRHDRGWRLTRKRYVMAVMSIHWFDGYRWLLGEEPSKVFCRGVNSPLTEGGEDTGVSITLEFPGGTIACLSESFSSLHSMDYCCLDCERGSIVMEYSKMRCHTAHDKAYEIVNPRDKAEATYVVLEDLLDAVRDRREPETSASDNLKSMRILEAAYLSFETGQVVRTEDLK